MTERIRTKTPVDFSGLSYEDYWDAVFAQHPTDHECGVDCRLYFREPGNPESSTGHMMYPSEPSTAAGRYQWEQNQKIMTRREWDATGQDESRECRKWNRDRARKIITGQYPHPNELPVTSRRSKRHSRKLFATHIEDERDSEGDLITDEDLASDMWGSPEGYYE